VSEIDAARWHEFYEEMLAETDTRTLKDRAELLETAMFLRCLQLQNSPESEGELAQIREAAKSLRKVQVEKLGFPGSTLGLDIGKPSSGQQ
jgi:hypothetical protein